MEKRDTRLLPFIVEYEAVMKSVELDEVEHDRCITAVMNAMEQQFGIPYLNNEGYNQTFPECIALYRLISDSRIALGDEGVFQLGHRVTVVDGLLRRTAKAFDRKDIGTSVRFFCIDQSGEFGYAFDEQTIEWTGTEFVYDCRKYGTLLNRISM